MFNKHYTKSYFRWIKSTSLTGWMSQNGRGKGDALWRTSMAFMAYSESDCAQLIFNSIKSCFREFTMINKKRKYAQCSRAPQRYREDDVSRDQLIMALAALRIGGMDYPPAETFLNDLIPKLSFRISRRFIMTPTLWFWIKGLRNGNFFTYSLCELITRPFVQFISRIVSYIIGLKSYSLEYRITVDSNIPYWSKSTGKWLWVTKPSDWISNGHKLYNEHLHKKERSWIYRRLYSMVEPGYSKTLSVFMAHISGNKHVKNLLWKTIPNQNKLHALLLDKPCDDYNFKPVKSFVWNSNFNGTDSLFYLATKELFLYNYLPKDLINSIAQKTNHYHHLV